MIRGANPVRETGDSSVRKELSCQITVRDVFACPTPATLVGRLASARDRPPLLPADRSEPAHLSFEQERMWFLHELSELAVYNIPVVFRIAIPVVFRIAGPVHAAALQTAWHDLAQRHEAFRTRFVAADGAVTQIVEPEPLAPLLVRTVGADSAHSALRDLVTRKFDLAREAPYRVELLRVPQIDGPDEHVFALVMHHIISDGWSTGLLLREFFGRYQARASGTEDYPVDALPVQYTDYTVWQRSLLGSYAQPTPLAQEQLSFWKNQLNGSPVECQLPADRARGAHPTYAGGAVVRDLPHTARQQIAELAQATGTSEFMALHAMLAVTLLRLGAGTDIVIGTATAGRNDPALDSVLGLFVNTLALRVDLGGNPDFRTLLGRVKEADTLAFAHQDIPFEWVVEAAGAPRHVGKNPLFQVALSVENTSAADYASPATGFTAEPVPSSTAKFDLLFTVNTAAGTVALEYSEDLFDNATAEMIADVFLRVVRSTLQRPDAPVTEHEIVDEAEEAVAASGEAISGTLCERFARAAAEHPDAPAVLADGFELSYQELDAASDQCAKALAARGVRAGDRVAIALAVSADYVISALAALKAAAVVVPLDPKLPDERLNTIIDESQPALVVADATFRGRTGLRRHELSVLADDLRSSTSTAELPRTATEQSPAYLLFTSGSTGKPKGIVLPHRCFLALAQDAVVREMGGGRMLMHSATAFDASALEMWAPLLHGGALVLMTPRDRDLADYETTIRRHNVTAAFFATALFNVIAVDRPEIFAELRTVLFGGEAASPPLVRKAVEAAPGVRFVNGYGPTETFAFVLSHTAAGDEAAIPIGSPNVLVDAYVLDANKRRMPPGCPGQLHIAGPQVALGYWRQPELTARQFVENPHRTGTMYATGDPVRRKPDGAFEYLGRMDRQVKIRGFRIELDEILGALAQFPQVGLAHLMVWREEGVDDQLLAYVVPANGRAIAPQEIRQTLLDRLPAYMAPQIVVVDALPLTTNGKVDESALPRRTPDGSASARPETELEKQIAALFADVLGGSADIDVHTDFFQLGGTSLSALKLVAAVRRTFERDFSIIEFIRCASISRLAARLASPTVGPAAAQAFDMLVPAQVVPGSTPLFCVHPGVGFSWQYLNLLPHFPDRSVYLVQAKGWDGDTDLPASVEAMARDYVRLIRTVSPQGPYHLIGWSLGGYLVHEMTKQLQQDAATSPA